MEKHRERRVSLFKAFLRGPHPSVNALFWKRNKIEKGKEEDGLESFLQQMWISYDFLRIPYEKVLFVQW